MSKHTPGPWMIAGLIIRMYDENEDHATDFFRASSGGGMVGTLVQAARVSIETAKANAHLIAAAPDLLTTLENLINKIEEMSGCRQVNHTAGHEECYPEFDAARAVIAKAKGEA